MTREELPKVSIIITTYKRAEALEKAIDSVLNQTYENIEVIVVDDNDADTTYRKNTANIMKRYEQNFKVHYVQHEKNMNGAAARNTGIQHSSGMYLTYLDDDDTYRPDKILKQVDYLLANPQFDAVYCGWNRDGLEESPSKEGDLSFEVLSGELILRTNILMVKRENTIRFGGWDERYTRNQEAVYLLRYFRDGGKIGAVTEVLVDYDVSDRSNASNPEKNEKDFEFFLTDHSNMIEDVSKKVNRDKELIYSYRYRSVFLRYLKFKDFKNAFRIYLKLTKRIPVRFNVDLLKYTAQKIF